MYFIVETIRISPIFPTIYEFIVLIFSILIGIIGLYLLVYYITKNQKKSSLTVGLFSFLVFLIPIFQDYIRKEGQEGISVEFLIGLCIVLTVTIFAIIKLFRSKKNFSLLIKYLAFTFVILLLFEFAKLGQIKWKKIDRTERSVKATLISSKPPDVYFIIADSYTSFESLEKYWGYKDTCFINFLNFKGFIILSNSRTQYNFTPWSIASTLNAGIDVDTTDNYDVLDLIYNNHFIGSLREIGYRFINLSFFPVLGEKRYYSFYPSFASFPQSFSEYLFARTIFYRLSKELVIRYSTPRANKKVLSALEKISTDKDSVPRIVYAHIFLPHPPFVYDRYGKEISIFDRKSSYNKDAYLDQVIYTDSVLTDLIGKLLHTNDDEENKIIIIQGDHGFRFLNNKSRNNEGHSILNIVRLPHMEKINAKTSIYSFESISIALNNFIRFEKTTN
jgi:hypothetical protein